MFNALNAAATGMVAQSKQVEVISNNIANADTTGFKKLRADFEDLLYHTSTAPGSATSATTQNSNGVQIGAGVRVAGTSRELMQGPLRPTGRDLDVAIEGPGFLAVQTPNGEVAYTRDGSLRLGPEGRIETVSGYALVPEIVVPPNTQGLQISPEGQVSVRGSGGEVTEIGQIQLSTFANPAGLLGLGGNLLGVSPGSGAPVPGNAGDATVGKLHQQFLEASNVSPVTEMTDLIRAQRAYELGSKVLGTTDQMLSTIGQIR